MATRGEQIAIKRKAKKEKRVARMTKIRAGNAEKAARKQVETAALQARNQAEMDQWNRSHPSCGYYPGFNSQSDHSSKSEANGRR